jgi:hypothetical protein
LAYASFLIAQDHNNSLDKNVVVAVVEEAGADEADDKDPALKSNVASDEDPDLKSCVAIVEEAVVDKADEDDPPFVPVLHTIMEADGWCYVEIQKAMYGLKESGFIANQELKKILGK